MRIDGSCTQVEKLLARQPKIHCKPRFMKVIKYFRRLEEMLALFKIYSSEPDDGEDPIETKKE